MIPYTLQRKRNCTRIKIRVKEGEVFVSSPYSVSKSKIDEFVSQNEKWILNTINRQDQSILHNGDTINILGKSYTIYIGNKSLILDDSITVRNQKDFERVSNILAKQLLEPICLDLFKQLKLYNIQLEYHTYSSKWGSCSKKERRIKLNSYLIYTGYNFCVSVILHECAHLFEMNHSKRFYDILLTWYPHYKEVQKPYKNFQFPRIE